MRILKRPFCLFFVFLFFAKTSSSQIWEKKYGYPNVSEQSMSSMSNYDDGFVLAVRANNQTGLWLIKTNKNGQILYSHTIYIQDYTFFSGSTIETYDGGTVTSGGYASLGTGGWLYPNIISIDNCGNLLWCKHIAINGGWALRIKEVSSGNYVLHTINASNNFPIERNQLWGIDSTGKINWHNQIVPEDEVPFNGTYIFDFSLTSDRGYLLTGYCYYPDPQNPGWDRLQYLLVKTDSIGNAEWIQPNGLDTNNIGALYSCIQHGNAYYSVGFWYGPVDTIVPPCVNKYDLNGNLIYSRILHSDTLNNMLVDVDVLNDSTLAMVGKCTHGYYDWIYMGVFTADTSGNLIHSMQNENGAPLEECLSVTSDEKLLCTGYTPISGLPHFDAFAIKLNANLEYDSIYTQPFTYDSLCPYPIVSDTLVCDCEPFVSVKEAQQARQTLLIKPNPATEWFTAEVPYTLPKTGTLRVYDMQGRLQYETLLPPGTKQISLNCSTWKRGIYLVHCLGSGIELSGKLIVD
jgi:hypothetical protein